MEPEKGKYTMSTPLSTPTQDIKADTKSDSIKRNRAKRSTSSLIIPQKRPLQVSSPRFSTQISKHTIYPGIYDENNNNNSKDEDYRNHNYKTVVSSDTISIIPFQVCRPAFSSLSREQDQVHDHDHDHDHNQDQIQNQYNNKNEKEKDIMDRTSFFNSSITPQPFLQPEILERVILSFKLERTRQQRREQRQQGNEGEVEEDEEEEAIDSEPEQNQQDRQLGQDEASAEYGSLAIRNRMRVRSSLFRTGGSRSRRRFRNDQRGGEREERRQ
jgi:hypothetical protein